MCTAFPYGRFRERRLQGLDYASRTSGSFSGGPWALRPKRLQWLTNITTGFKIAAFRKWVWQMLVLAPQLLSIVIPVKAGICVFFNENRDARLRGHDGKKACAISSKVNHTSRAFRPYLFSRILIGAKPGRNFPSIFSFGNSAVT